MTVSITQPAKLNQKENANPIRTQAWSPKMFAFIAEPEFFPPLQYFYGLNNSVVWFVIDHTQYRIRSHHNRCRVKTGTGITLLSISVKRPCNRHLYDTIIDNSFPWKRIFLKTLENNYKNAPFYRDYAQALANFVNSPHVLLENFNVDAACWICGLMGIKPKIAYSKFLTPKQPLEELPATVFKLTGALPLAMNFQEPHYPQMTEPFEEDLSVLDALFCIGAKGTRYLLAEQKAVPMEIRV